MVEAKHEFWYLPAPGFSLVHVLEIEINGRLYVGDESSLTSKNPVHTEDEPMTIDPEPPYWIAPSSLR